MGQEGVEGGVDANYLWPGGGGGKKRGDCELGMYDVKADARDSHAKTNSLGYYQGWSDAWWYYSREDVPRVLTP